MRRCRKTSKFFRSLGAFLFINSLICFTVGFSEYQRAYAADALSLDRAVEKGKVEVDAVGNGNYSNISLTLTNKTNDSLDVDLNGTYFTPPEGSSSQRLGVSHIEGTDGDSTVDLGPKEKKQVKASAFCIDASKGIPGYDEDFTFGGHVSDIEERPYLDEILEWYKNNPDASHYEVQDAVWSVESDHEGENWHYNEAAAAILEQATGSKDPLTEKLELDEQKEDTLDKAKLALGTGLASLLGVGSLYTLTGTPNSGLQSLLKGIGGIFNKSLELKNPNAELVDNLEVDNLTETILGQGENSLKTKVFNKDGTLKQLDDTKLSQTYKQGMTALGIFNDANALHKDGYNDNIVQSLGLSTMMNLGANTAMDALDNWGAKNLGTIETFAKLFLPKSTQDILPSNIVKQTIQAAGDVTKALAQSFGSGDWEPLNQYAQDVADGKKGLMLSGYGQIGQAAGEIVAAIEDKGIVQTTKDFISDVKQIIDTGAAKDVIMEGINKIADEAKASSSADRGIAELSDLAGHVVGTIESKGVVDGTKEMAGQLVEDVKTIIKHGDFEQISKDVGDSAEKATGMIGKGVAEASSLVGEYYEEGGGVVGGIKQFGSDCALIWKYLW
ncbi:MAG TPA: hypothetical protein PKL83_05010 [bacterium]|nr:hypothetical protein [bacterium]